MKNSRNGCLAAILSIIALTVGNLIGQVSTPTPPPIGGVYPNFPAPPYAIITYPAVSPSTQTASVVSPAVDGIFQLVGLQPDQVVQVIVQYPPSDLASQAGQLVNLEALDGGIVLPPSTPAAPIPTAQPGPIRTLPLNTNATVTFTFKASHNPGKNQISLRRGSEELGLQFWVFDQQEPQTNPPAITPSNPYPAAH